MTCGAGGGGTGALCFVLGGRIWGFCAGDEKEEKTRKRTSKLETRKFWLFIAVTGESRLLPRQVCPKAASIASGFE